MLEVLSAQLWVPLPVMLPSGISTVVFAVFADVLPSADPTSGGRLLYVIPVSVQDVFVTWKALPPSGLGSVTNSRSLTVAGPLSPVTANLK